MQIRVEKLFLLVAAAMKAMYLVGRKEKDVLIKNSTVCFVVLCVERL